MPVFWILADICTPGTAFPCTVGARVRKYYHLYMHYIYTCALANPGLCSGGNRKVVHCSVPVLIKMMIVKSLIIVHCLVPVLIAIVMTKVLVPVWID